MASFIETEWGVEARTIMRDLKALLDPDHMLNPDVIINNVGDPQSGASKLVDTLYASGALA